MSSIYIGYAALAGFRFRCGLEERCWLRMSRTTPVEYSVEMWMLFDEVSAVRV